LQRKLSEFGYRRAGMSYLTATSARLWRSLLFLVAALFSGAAYADAPVVAHPVFWTIHGPAGTAYILGSVHALPPKVSWRSKQIDEAARVADTYIFEVPDGPAEIDEETQYILERGRLPQGETLQKLLSAPAQRNYVAACALAGMKKSSLDDKRPWLAAIVLTISYMNQRNFTSKNTPDDTYLESARRNGKTLQYFDTTRQQLEVLSHFDQTMGLDGFSAMLGDFTQQPEREEALISAWASGNLLSITSLIENNLRSDPEIARIIAEHNRVWARKLEDLLSTNRTYFVVVGIAHLIGQAGVPALLRSDGFKVEGP
jgi:uncharacterized protein YbaP (TraB family)